MSVVEITSSSGVDVAYTANELARERAYRAGSRWHDNDTYKRVPGYGYTFENGEIRCLRDITSPGWNGGYPLAFYDARIRVSRDKQRAWTEATGGGPLCQDCAAKLWPDMVADRLTFWMESIEQSESGDWCENCNAVIAYPYCQECYDVAGDDERFAAYEPDDDKGYGFLCPTCANAAKLKRDIPLATKAARTAWIDPNAYDEYRAISARIAAARLIESYDE